MFFSEHSVEILYNSLHFAFFSRQCHLLAMVMVEHQDKLAQKVAQI